MILDNKNMKIVEQDNQILGLTSIDGKIIVGASYFDPGFYINKKESAGIGGLRKIEFIGTDLSLLKGNWGGKHVFLWDNPGRSHSNYRAQVGQIGQDHKRFIYLSNSGDSINVLDLEKRISSDSNFDKLPFKGTPPRLYAGFDERIEYFLELEQGIFVTIENCGDCKLGVYKENGESLNKQNEVNLSVMDGLMQNIDMDITEHIDGVVEGKANMLYGLAFFKDQLLLLPDKRSTLTKGVYAIDIPNGVDSLSEGSKAKIVQGSENIISGNGIAPTKDGLYISKYTFTRETMVGKETPKLMFIPFTQ